MKSEPYFFAVAIGKTVQRSKSCRSSCLSILLYGLALCFTPVVAKTISLEDPQSSSACPEKRAAILVGGIREDWSYFTPWVPGLQKQGICVFGFVYDHTTSTMPEGANLLSRDLNGLREQGFREILVLAHSMGGLVAKRALQLAPMDGKGVPVAVRFHAYGTPWGGFFWANFVRFTPGTGFLLKRIGLPMAVDIGSTSAFMVSLQSPLPPNVTTTLHNSLTDTVATPQTWDGKQLFASATEQAQQVHTYSDLGHAEYVAKLNRPEF